MESNGTSGNQRCRDQQDVLNRYAFFRSAESDLQEQLKEAANFVTVSDGQVVMQAGALCEQVLFVGYGRVRVYVEAASTRQLNLYTVEIGESCPINIRAAMTSAPADANGAAVGDVCAALIPARQFRELSSESATITDWLLSETSARYAEIITLLGTVVTQSVDQRLARYLIEQARTSGDGTRMVVATHDHVARDLGTAREVVSRRLSSLEKDGLIQLGRGQVTLIDEKRLLERV